MPKYAQFDPTSSDPQYITGWYDTDLFSYPNLPAETDLIAVTDNQWNARVANPAGWALVGGVLTSYSPFVPPPPAAQVAAAALLAGVTITSTATPALNGTYACDAVSQADIIAIETSLNAGKGFPGGSNPFGYPDVTGALHPFSADDFTNFAAVVRDFVYGVKAYAASLTFNLPSATATIP